MAVFFDPALWGDNFRLTCQELSNLLIEKDPWKTGGNLAASNPEVVRIWLHLWLCLQLLSKFIDNPKAGLSIEQWQFLADLAYILREGLRFFNFGERPYYFRHASTYTASLCALIRRHCHDVVGIPGTIDIQTFFAAILEGSSGSRAFSSKEHICHLMDVYVMGHFLLSLQVKYKEKLSSFGEVMIGGINASVLPGKEKIASLKKAFSLAALYHDVGHLFFLPGWDLNNKFFQSDPWIETFFSLSRIKRNEAGKMLIEQCLSDFGTHAYFNPQREFEIRDWIEGQRIRGEPDHSLLSAWYLHKIAAREKLHSDEIIKAIRAVLLHRALSVRIENDKDPVAALLVLCDELLDWDPRKHNIPTASTSDRVFHYTTADIKPEDPVFASILIEGLTSQPPPDTLETENSEQKCTKFNMIFTAEEGKYWPRIAMELQRPDRLYLPVFKIWLTKSQNLSRITFREEDFFAPQLTINSTKPIHLGRQINDSLHVLELLAARSDAFCRKKLREWVGYVSEMNTC